MTASLIARSPGLPLSRMTVYSLDSPSTPSLHLANDIQPAKAYGVGDQRDGAGSGVTQSLLAGIDIGGTKTSIVLSTRLPSVIVRHVFSTDPERGPGPAISEIIKGLRILLALGEVAGARLTAIGVSCGGPLDAHHGIIQQPPNLPTWRDVPITATLSREFAVNCYLENDANAGALAEHSFGAGQGMRNLVFLTMGTGIGAGLILNGHLYRGATEAAGEIGHVRLTPQGPQGHGKAGSVEGWASGGGLANLARMSIADASAEGRHTALAKHRENLHALTARDVAEAAESGDPLAKQIIHTTGERLGEAMAILIDLLNPECILVGGLALRLGDALLNPARRVIEREALAPSARACQILPAALGEQTGDVAALCVGMNGENHEKQLGA